MTRTLLYYPTIDITNPQWVKNSILYWDSIGSIVPRNLEKKYLSSTIIKTLQTAGLFEPFYPEDHVEKERGLAREFIDRHQSLRTRKLLKSSPPNPGYFKVSYWKFPDEVRNYLLEHKYAIRSRDWLVLDRLDGLLYMSVLAKYIADQTTYMLVTPGTDHLEYQDLAFRANDLKNSIRGAQVTIRGYLPMPVVDVPLIKIIEFKKKREDELQRFQKTIDVYNSRLNHATEDREVREIIRDFRVEMPREVEHIGKLFDDQKISYVLGAVKTLIGIGVPSSLEFFTSLSYILPTWLKILITGTAGAISIGSYMLDIRDKQREISEKSAYSYVYYAGKEGIIKPISSDNILDLLR
jgi:hypothetical protein